MYVVLNVYLHQCKGAVSIMRGTQWGNPFIIGKDGTRENVIRLFSKYAIWRLTQQPKWLHPLKHKNLKCCCAPLPCHGDILMMMLKDVNS
jgi:hypothetical protein